MHCGPCNCKRNNAGDQQIACGQRVSETDVLAGDLSFRTGSVGAPAPLLQSRVSRSSMTTILSRWAFGTATDLACMYNHMQHSRSCRRSRVAKAMSAEYRASVARKVAIFIANGPLAGILPAPSWLHSTPAWLRSSESTAPF